ncbi:MAG: DUF3604 domain-containing protein [Armatimonadetes bacterium]|nr:DUF3604 domain-containing protein [Armatimonadota bacterium]
MKPWRISPEEPFWGELHTHTALSDGQRLPDEAVADARDHLDFWAPADHLCLSFDRAPNKKLMDGWQQLQAVLDEWHKPGEFVTFLAYEYSSLEGDWNLYFPTLAGEPYNPPDIKHLCEYAREVKGMLVPHHTGYKVNGRGIDWSRSYEADVMPLAEVFSMHGSSEADDGYWPMDLPWMGPRATAGCVRTGLSQGARVGFIASSDGHGGYPGCYKMGLAAVWAGSLEREDIWQAMYSRRCYAVTGDRILVQFFVNGEPMGGELPHSHSRFIEAKTSGLEQIEWVDIIKNGSVWHRYLHPITAGASADGNRWVVRLEWGWGHRAQEWDIAINVHGGRIVRASPNFGPPGPNRFVHCAQQSLTLLSHTDGRYAADWRYCRNGREGTQQVVLEIEGVRETIINFAAGSFEAEATVGELSGESRVWYFDDEFSPKVKFHRALPEQAVSATLELEDDGTEPAYYYVRVRQQNGQMAWCSPVWVGRE